MPITFTQVSRFVHPTLPCHQSVCAFVELKLSNSVIFLFCVTMCLKYLCMIKMCVCVCVWGGGGGARSLYSVQVCTYTCVCVCVCVCSLYSVQMCVRVCVCLCVCVQFIQCASVYIHV